MIQEALEKRILFHWIYIDIGIRPRQWIWIRSTQLATPEKYWFISSRNANGQRKSQYGLQVNNTATHCSKTVEFYYHGKTFVVLLGVIIRTNPEV